MIIYKLILKYKTKVRQKKVNLFLINKILILYIEEIVKLKINFAPKNIIVKIAYYA